MKQKKFLSLLITGLLLVIWCTALAKVCQISSGEQVGAHYLYTGESVLSFTGRKSGKRCSKEYTDHTEQNLGALSAC